MMRKLREEDRLQREEERLRQAGAQNALREENERLRQRLERNEKAQHSRNVHAEGDSSRSADQPQPGRERNEPQQERQVEVSYQDDRDATSRHVEDSADHQFPFTDEILAMKLLPNWNNPTLDKYNGTTGRAVVQPPKFRDTLGVQRFTRYTPLNTGQTRILEEALSTDLMKEPKRGTSPQHADQSKYCQYHRCHDHITVECQALKDKIEELIQAGHLQRYDAKRRQLGWRQ